MKEDGDFIIIIVLPKNNTNTINHQCHLEVYTQRMKNRVVKRDLHSHVHSGTIRNSQKVEAAHVCMDR